MAIVVLFHSALGLRPAVHDFADAIRAAGHTVHVPDYYDGRIFATAEEGVAHRDRMGRREIERLTSEALSGLPAGLVYAGFSLGAGEAQRLARERPGAKGAIAMHDAIPSEWFAGPWPRSVPLQIHTAEHDPWVDLDEARALAYEAGGTLFLYPGSGHLFADPGLPDYDRASAELMLSRVLAFIAGL